MHSVFDPLTTGSPLSSFLSPLVLKPEDSIVHPPPLPSRRITVDSEQRITADLDDRIVNTE